MSCEFYDSVDQSTFIVFSAIRLASLLCKSTVLESTRVDDFGDNTVEERLRPSLGGITVISAFFAMIIFQVYLRLYKFSNQCVLWS